MEWDLIDKILINFPLLKKSVINPQPKQMVILITIYQVPVLDFLFWFLTNKAV